MIYEVKLKEMMGVVFQELVKMSDIANKLVGTVKLANEEQQDDCNSLDKSKVKLMSNAGGGNSAVDDRAVRAAGSGSAGTGSRVRRLRRSGSRPRPCSNSRTCRNAL